MTPPAATAATTADDVQLPAVPVPMTRAGCDVFTGCAPAGNATWPFGLPALGNVVDFGFFGVVFGFFGVVVVVGGGFVVVGTVVGATEDALRGTAPGAAVGWPGIPQADRARPEHRTAPRTRFADLDRTARNGSTRRAVRHSWTAHERLRFPVREAEALVKAGQAWLEPVRPATNLAACATEDRQDHADNE
jgi:hypothetical protein